MIHNSNQCRRRILYQATCSRGLRLFTFYDNVADEKGFQLELFKNHSMAFVACVAQVCIPGDKAVPLDKEQGLDGEF